MLTWKQSRELCRSNCTILQMFQMLFQFAWLPADLSIFWRRGPVPRSFSFKVTRIGGILDSGRQNERRESRGITLKARINVGSSRSCLPAVVQRLHVVRVKLRLMTLVAMWMMSLKILERLVDAMLWSVFVVIHVVRRVVMMIIIWREWSSYALNLNIVTILHPVTIENIIPVAVSMRGITPDRVRLGSLSFFTRSSRVTNRRTNEVHDCTAALG